MPWVGWLKQQTFISHSSRGWEVQALADLESEKDTLSASKVAIFSLRPHVAEGVSELSGVSFIGALIPFMGLHPVT